MPSFSDSKMDGYQSLDGGFGALVLDVGRLTTEQYEIAAKIIHTIERFAELTGDRDHPGKAGVALAEPQRRPHHAIVIEGERGSGKTSLLLTLQSLINRSSGEEGCVELRKLQKIDWRPVGKMRGIAHALPIIYPAQREADGLLMEDLFAAISRELKEAEKTEKTPYWSGESDEKKMLRELRDKLNAVWEGWVFGSRMGTEMVGRDSVDFKDYATQRADLATAAYQRQKNWADFVDAYLDYKKVSLLVICFDDSDLKPTVSAEVAEALHLYLSHPRIVTILAAAWNDLRSHLNAHELAREKDYLLVLARIERTEVQEKSQFPIFLQAARRNTSKLDDAINDIEANVTQYLDKIMPRPLRFTLPDVQRDATVLRILVDWHSSIDSPLVDESFTPLLTLPANEATASEGVIGLWLWRNRHRSIFSGYSMRKLTQLRSEIELFDWKDGEAGGLVQGRWKPQQMLRRVLGKVPDAFILSLTNRADEAFLFDPQNGGWQSISSSTSWTYSDKVDSLMSFLADLESARTFVSARRFARLPRGYSLPKTSQLAEAIIARFSPLIAEAPANCIYCADAVHASAALVALRPDHQAGWEKLSVELEMLRVDPTHLQSIDRFAAGITDPQCDAERRGTFMFNAWLYWRTLPKRGVIIRRSDIGAQEFLGLVQEYREAPQGSRIQSPAADFVGFAQRLADLSQLVSEQSRVGLTQIRAALQIAMVPAASDLGGVQMQVMNEPNDGVLRLLADVVTGRADTPVSWRDRFMLCLAALLPLRSLAEIAAGPIAVDDLESCRDRLISFLRDQVPASMPSSAFDIASVLGSWEVVRAEAARLADDLEAVKCSAIARNAAATWLGLPPNAVRALRDAHRPG